MPDVYYANQINMTMTSSAQPQDRGDILLVFETLCPVREPADPAHAYETISKVVVAMTHANACALRDVLTANLELTPEEQRGYRGPVIRQR